jgi:hypothetical protein
VAVAAATKLKEIIPRKYEITQLNQCVMNISGATKYAIRLSKALKFIFIFWSRGIIRIRKYI